MVYFTSEHNNSMLLTTSFLHSTVPVQYPEVISYALTTPPTMACTAALYPIDTIKTRLQLMLKGGGFKALVKQGGAKNLYAGVWGNLAGVAPASAVFMAVYEPIKAALNERIPENRSFLAPLGAGSAAGLAASVIRVPTEVVKQRLQSGKHALLID